MPIAYFHLWCKCCKCFVIVNLFFIADLDNLCCGFVYLRMALIKVSGHYVVTIYGKHFAAYSIG